MLKARDNPFAMERLERLLTFEPALSGLSWDEIDRRLEQNDYHCAIAGNHGTGKTTLLDALELRFAERGWDVVRLFFNDRQQPTLCEILALRGQAGVDAIVLCDGSELLPWIHWLALRQSTRHARGCIVTTHRHCRLPTAITLTSSPDLLANLLQRVDPAAHWLRLADTLYNDHRGNLREALRACYQLAETSTSNN